MARNKRATNEELCIRYTKERSVLYSKRTRLKKQLSKATKKKEIASIDKKINTVTNKINRTTEKLFKCSKKYLKIKAQRKELLNKINAIKRYLKKNRDLDNKEFYKKVDEITEINEQVRELNLILGLKVEAQEKAIKISSFDVQKDTFNESFTIWELRAKMEKLLLDEQFSFLVVNGEKYSLELSMMSALWAVDDLIATINAQRLKSKTKTPSVTVQMDFKNRTITI